MSADQLTSSATARNPRGAVKLTGDDGIAVFFQGWTVFETDNNAARSADTFRIEFAIAGLSEARGIDWFSSQKSITAEIFAGLPSDPANVQISDMSSLIYGEVDDIQFDLVRGVVELSGRDLTARLIDELTSESHLNQTASSIAKSLALKHGLTPVVAATKGFAGTYYKEDHISSLSMRSEWELLSYLAEKENFLLYVNGKELHFEPKPSESDGHYIIEWNGQNEDRGFATSNTIDLQFSRSLTIAKGITVEVRSWNEKQKNGFSAFYPKTARSIQPGQSAAKTLKRRFSIPNLTPEDAQKIAESKYRQIIQHEVRLTAYLPADQQLDCTKTILVRGTNTKLDQVYYLESVRRTMSVHEGYRMNIRARNKAPETEL